MTTHPPSSVASVIDKFNALVKERAWCAARIGEIDALLAGLGDSLEGRSQAPRSPAPAKPDGRSTGTLTEHMIEVLRSAENGLTRMELRAEIEKNDKFRQMVGRSPNAYYNNIIRLRAAERVIERRGRLYHPDRAPPSDEEVSDNVRPLRGLFASERNMDLG